VPEQLKNIPIVGERIYDQLTLLASDKDQLTAIAQRLLEPAGKLSVAIVKTLGDGILQLLLVTFIVFFYYRDGHRVADIIGRISGRISGEMSVEVLDIIVNTTRSVFLGLVGTAAAQAVAAFIGFMIAGVPGAFLLSVGTSCCRSCRWARYCCGRSAVWLYLQGETGGRSSWSSGRGGHQQHRQLREAAADSARLHAVARPDLSRRARRVIAFGFIGVILGPVLLALGMALGRKWISARDTGIPEATDAVIAAAAATAAAIEPTGSTPKVS